MAENPSKRALDIAWAAGFFEGEGHIKAAQRGNCKWIALEVAQVYREPLDKLQEIFGGKVYGPYGPYATNKQPYFQYILYGNAVYEAVHEMLPWLYRKGEQCRAAIQKMEEYNANKN